MNTGAEPISPIEARASVMVAVPAYHRFLWTVRRELWEHRSIFLAPLAVAALFIVSVFIGGLHGLSFGIFVQDAGSRRHQSAAPFDLVALVIMGTTFLVTVFYSLDALYGERRDRSVLFWKSLPVSDLTTVLAKASIPLLVVPLLTFAITVVTQCVMLLLNNLMMLARGQSAAGLGTAGPLFHIWLALLYHLVAYHSLWWAPIFCWLLLVSAWAKRAPFLWAVLPPAAIVLLERLAFNTTHFAQMLAYRFAGHASTSVEQVSPNASNTMGSMPEIDLGQFLATPGLWVGLAVAAAFLLAAVRLRRYREPI